MPGVTTAPVSSDPFSQPFTAGSEVHALVLAWSSEDPLRAGEVTMLPRGERQVLGRGSEGDDPQEARVPFFRQRPGLFEAAPPLSGAGLSRRQLVLELRDDGLSVECVGRCPMGANGVRCDRALLRPGDTLRLGRELVLLYTLRPALFPRASFFPQTCWGPFGEVDVLGILGESPATWALRERAAVVAKSGTHCLITGASGTGKELAARAVHALSGAPARRFVARNASTLPATLVDAELFGNARNYPNAGMAERRGLVGEADGGTLFLDEIGELPVDQQAHLLRVLDQGGEYQRLGESTTRRSAFRLVGATNRDPSALKHDLLARLTSVIQLAPLAARREDIPLLARHLVVSAAARSPDLAGRFVDRDDRGRARVRFAASFVDWVLRQDLENNVRELDAVLWEAMADAPADTVVPPAGASREGDVPPPHGAVHGSPPTSDQVRAALAAANRSVAGAARALGVSRYALYRLMKRYGVQEGPDD